jgi:lysozyme family protein
MTWQILVPLMLVRVLIDVVRRAGAAPEPAVDDQRVFDVALAHVLKMEGGWTNDPHDPGGPTNRGIILADLAKQRGTTITSANRDRLIEDLRNLSDHETRTIYREQYWLAARCPALPSKLAFFHFDAAVNHGVAGAARLLQQALAVEVDGVIGPITRDAARSANVDAVLDRYAELRRRRYRSLPHFWRFGRGWLSRVASTLAAARNLSLEPGKDKRMTTSPANNSTGGGKSWGESLTLWGALVTAATTVLPLLGPILGLELTPELIKQAGEQTVAVVQAVGGLVGTLMVIFGRTRATRPLQFRLSQA